MRLRQVVLVARDLAHAVTELEAELGIEVAYRDPGVSHFGLENAVLPVGDQFLEVVSPVQPDAPAARYLARHGGADGGYMLMFQVGDLAAERKRLEGLGVRIVWSAELPDIAGAHLHPKDTGGALLSFDEARPPESWRWAGPDWRAHARTGVARGIAGATLSAPDPAALARRFGEILARAPRPRAGGGAEIALDGGALAFVPGARERLTGFAVHAADRARAGRHSRLVGVDVAWV
jgi:hypothetical protein